MYSLVLQQRQFKNYAFNNENQQLSYKAIFFSVAYANTLQASLTPPCLSKSQPNILISLGLPSKYIYTLHLNINQHIFWNATFSPLLHCSGPCHHYLLFGLLQQLPDFAASTIAFLEYYHNLSNRSRESSGQIPLISSHVIQSKSQSLYNDLRFMSPTLLPSSLCHHSASSCSMNTVSMLPEQCLGI